MEDNDNKRKRQDNEGNTQKESDTEVAADVKMADASTAAASHRFAALQRPDGQGMNPKSILMGIYGPRGEKIRHTVHEGSLKLPAPAIGILNDVQRECLEQTFQTHPTESFELPAIDGVIRPTMDNINNKAIIITELTATEASPPQVPMVMDAHGQMVPAPQPPPPQEKWQTHARNWKLKLPSKADTEERICGAGNGVIEEERIRGGGDDDVEMKDASPDAKKLEAADAFAPPGGETQESKSESAAEAVPTMETAKPATTSAPTASAPSTSAGESAPAPAVAPTSTAAATGNASSSTSATAVADSQKAPSTVTSAAPASVVTSSSPTAPKAKVPAVIPLPAKPQPQWEQHVPGPNDEMQTEPKTPHPSWYSADGVSDLECNMLPEWFDGSATHRTLDTYKQARERIIEISDKLGQRYVTGTLVRRTIPGDAGSLLRLHNFLTTWGFINEDAINDSAPTAPGFREDTSGSRYNKTNVVWNETSREELMNAVVDESKKRRKTDDDTSFVPIDWAVVSKRVGNGTSASDCEKVFLALPLEAAAQKLKERSITPDVTSSEQKDDRAATDEKAKMDLREKILKDIVDEARPEVVKAATDAALAATDNVAEAQKAGLLALVASEAAVRAKQEEETVSRLLAELQEQRLQKLENRLALLDDVEGVLEAERVALELERRDLYTARCRHWFGGAS